MVKRVKRQFTWKCCLPITECAISTKQYHPRPDSRLRARDVHANEFIQVGSTDNISVIEKQRAERLEVVAIIEQGREALRLRRNELSTVTWHRKILHNESCSRFKRPLSSDVYRV